jgi:DNA-binding MarR family transcriptional regulator
MSDQEPNDSVALLVELLRLATIINRPMRDGVADPEGLSLNELKVMMCLGGEGEMAGHEMAELIGMQPMNVSRALATLDEVGWVDQIDDATNRRRKPYRLSVAGWKAHQDMMPEVAEVARFLFVKLSTRERQTMNKILAKVTKQVDDWQTPRVRPHVSRA